MPWIASLAIYSKVSPYGNHAKVALDCKPCNPLQRGGAFLDCKACDLSQGMAHTEISEWLQGLQGLQSSATMAGQMGN
jgi:hypothetical protein